MSTFGVQGQLLEINILGCRNLRDKEWLSRQDPYVVIQYASTKFRSKTDTDGGKNPSFNQKFVVPLIEGLREINVEVWNSNTLTFDDFIGSGRILLDKALTSGYDDSTWNLTSKRGKYAGEVRTILHFNKVAKPAPVASAQYPTHQPPYSAAPPPNAYPYGAPPAAPYPAPPPFYNPQHQRPEYSSASSTTSSYSPYSQPHQPHQPPPGNMYQYPPPPPAAGPGYGGHYAPPSAPPAAPPPAPPAGYPPVYQEYPYRPYY